MDFFPHFIIDVITYPYWYKCQTLLEEGAPGVDYNPSPLHVSLPPHDFLP